MRLILLVSIFFIYANSVFSAPSKTNDGLVVCDVVLTPNFRFDKSVLQKVVDIHSQFKDHVGFKALKTLVTEDTLKASLVYYNGNYFIVSSLFPFIYADSTNATFTMPNGKKISYNNLDFTMLDKENQLAIFKLDDGIDKSVFANLQIIAPANKKNSANQFVSLIDNTGTLSSAVSNAKYKIKNKALNLDNTISHTIDIPLSLSGSPLCTTDSEGNIYFIAINLYESASGNNTGFATPVNEVYKTLANLDSQIIPSIDALDGIGEIFSNILNSKKIENIANFLKAGIVMDYVVPVVSSVNIADKEIFWSWIKDTDSQNLDKYFSKVVAVLFLDLGKISYRSSVVYDDSNKNEATIALYEEEKIVLCDWKYSYEGWQLDDLPKEMLEKSLKTVKETELSILTERKKNSGIFFGAGSLISNFRPFNLHVGYDVNPVKYFLASFMLAYEGMPYDISDDTYKAHFLEPSLALRFQVPIKTKQVRIVPFTGFKIGIPIMLASNLPSDNASVSNSNLYNSHVTLSVGWLAGMEFGIGPNPFYYVGFEMGFKEDSISRIDYGVGGVWYGRAYLKFAIY